MATAITDYDPVAAWLKIQDDMGATWTYRQVAYAEPNASPQVVSANTPGELTLARDVSNQAILRQEGPGLPKTIVVRLLRGASFGTGAPGGWEVLFLYQRD